MLRHLSAHAVGWQIDFGFRVAASRACARRWTPNCVLASPGRRGGAGHVRRHDGVQQRLATALSIEGPSLVRLLDNLERRGLIERRADESDRRARGIYLTRPGRDLAKRAAKVGGEIQARLLANVPPAELLACQHVLASIERDLEERLEIAAPAAD